MYINFHNIQRKHLCNVKSPFRIYQVTIIKNRHLNMGPLSVKPQTLSLQILECKSVIVNINV